MGRLHLLGWKPSIQLQGLIFLLIICGGEATRVEYNVRTQTLQAQVDGARQRAAVDRERRRSSSMDMNMEDLVEEILARDIGRDVVSNAKGLDYYDSEIVRGDVSYYMQGDLPGTAQRGTASVTPKRPASPTDSTSYEVSLTNAVGQSVLQFALRPDSLVVEGKDGSPRIEMYGELRSRECGFNPLCKRSGSGVLVLEMHSNAWISVDKVGKDMISDGLGSEALRRLPDELTVKKEDPKVLARSWLNAVKATQSLGTSLTAGKSLLMCTYIPSRNACSSNYFCDLRLPGSPENPGSSPQCAMKEGYEANTAAWGQLRDASLTAAGNVQKSRCLSTCREDWQVAQEGLGFLSAARKAAKLKALQASKGPRNIQDLNAEIIQEAEAQNIEQQIIEALSANFDKPTNLLFEPEIFFAKKGMQHQLKCSGDIFEDGAYSTILQKTFLGAAEKWEALTQKCRGLAELSPDATMEDVFAPLTPEDVRAMAESLTPEEKEAAMMLTQSMSPTAAQAGDAGDAASLLDRSASMEGDPGAFAALLAAHHFFHSWFVVNLWLLLSGLITLGVGSVVGVLSLEVEGIVLMIYCCFGGAFIAAAILFFFLFVAGAMGSNGSK